MRLTAQQVVFDSTQKTARLAAPADDQAPSSTSNAERARELLRGMATDLVSNGKVKGGYLRLSRDGEGARLAAGHFGSGATAATDLVKNLVRDAYGDVATRALDNYLSRSSGGKVGTQSFVKLVQSLESEHLSARVLNAEIKRGAKLNTVTQEGKTLGQAHRFDSEWVQGLQGRLAHLEPRVQTFASQINDPAQEPGEFLAQGRDLATELEDCIKLLMMRPNAPSLPEAKSVEQGLRGLLADVQCDLANALISRNQLDLAPEMQSVEVNGVEVAEAEQLLKNARQNAKSAGHHALESQAAEDLKTYFEHAPVDAQPMSDQDLGMIDAYREGGKTEMAPPEMQEGDGAYQSVSQYLRPPQEVVVREPSMARASLHDKEPLEDASHVGDKEVVAQASQGAWFHQDLMTRLKAIECGSADEAQAALEPRAQAIVDLSYEDNDAALNFLQQSAQWVNSQLSERLAEPPVLELDEHATGQGLKNIGNLIEQIYSGHKVSAEDYLTVSILLNMQRN